MVERLFSAEFYAMDGWASYVWPSYAVAAIAIGLLTLRILQRNARLRKELDVAEARLSRLKKSAAPAAQESAQETAQESAAS